jgi:hypothetical protein
MNRLALRTLAALVVSIGAVLVRSEVPAFAEEPPDAAQQQAEARAFAVRGTGAFDRGDYEAALTAFSEAERRYPTPQYSIYVARSLAHLGRLTRAAAVLTEAASRPPPAAVPRGFAEAQKLARDELAELRLRIPVIALAVEGSAEARVTVDGREVPPAERDHVEVDPEEHHIEATAPGLTSWLQSVTVKERETSTVAIHLVPLPSPSPSPPSPPDAAQVPADAVSPPVADLSHRRQLGAFSRLDVDAVHPGARVAAGVTYGILDHLEVGAAALLGKTSGLEPHLTGYVLRGAVKPFVEAAVPIFIMSGASAGVRGSAGVQWDPGRHFGFFAELGGTYVVNPPAGYVHGSLLPALGVQGRL